jgi:hypothetical protein
MLISPINQTGSGGCCDLHRVECSKVSIQDRATVRAGHRCDDVILPDESPRLSDSGRAFGEQRFAAEESGVSRRK